MTLVAGIDSSTQSCKVVVVDAATGAVKRSGRSDHPIGTEVDPEHWWNALRAAISAAGGLDDVEAISVGGQQHGMILLDDHGRVIRDALLWNDTRSASAADAIRLEIGPEEHARRTGLVPVASFTSTKLRWIRDHEPDSARRTSGVLLPHDWLTWRLLGRGGEHGSGLDRLTTDRSDASGTGYWSPATGEYDRDLLINAFGRDAILPRVLGPAESAGVTGGNDGIPPGLLVAAGAGDNAAAALGLGTRTGDAVVSLGTSGTVFAVSPTMTYDPSGTVAGFADASGGFLPLVTTLNAAQVVDMMADLLGVDHAEFGRLALSAPPGANGAVLVPYFAGERTPNLPHATASFHGLTRHSIDRASVARATIEGMMCGLAAGLEAIKGGGVEVSRVVLIGGGARLDATVAIASEVLEMPVVVPPPAEYVALGAAAQAAWALLGERPNWEIEGTRTVSSDPQPATRSNFTRIASQI